MAKAPTNTTPKKGFTTKLGFSEQRKQVTDGYTSNSTQMNFHFKDSFSIPVNKEVKSQDLLYWGDDNCYPQYLLDLYNGSPIHSAVCQGKVDYIFAEGLKSDKKPIQNFMSEVNNQGESLEDIFYKIVFDYELFGSYALQIVWGKGSSAKKPIFSEIYHLPVERFRYSIDQDKLKYSKSWSMTTRPKVIEYDTFDLSNPKGTQIFYHNGHISRNVYGRPNYEAAVASINTDRLVSEYHMNLVRSGMAMSMIINYFDGIPEEDEKKQIVRDISKKFRGPNGEPMMVNFSEPGTQAPQVIPNQTSDDDRFVRLMDATIQKIFSAHRVSSPSLFGLQTNAQKVGTTNEFEISYEVFQKTYVKPRQNQLLNVLNKLISINFKNSDISIVQMPPITMPLTDPRTLASTMYPSEMRKNLQNWNLIDDANRPANGESFIGNRDQPNLNIDVLANARKSDPNIQLPEGAEEQTTTVNPVNPNENATFTVII